MELSDECKGSLELLKKALAEIADAVQDPLSVSRNQQRQKVVDYADELRKWFRETYPSEDANLTVFIQQFVTGRYCKTSTAEG